MSRASRCAILCCGAGAALVAASVVAVTGSPRVDRQPIVREATVLLSSSPNRIAVIGDSYTSGYQDTGRGPANWTALAWQNLAGRGMDVIADVAAEGGAGYGVRGNHGSLFGDLTAHAVHPDDDVLVFFGSRNDQDADPTQLDRLIADTLGLARRTAPGARILVIGPPWPTADVPGSVWRIRDLLNNDAAVVGARFVDPLAEQWFVGRPDLIGPDGVHPNNAGQVYLSEKIAPLIAAELEQ